MTETQKITLALPKVTIEALRKRAEKEARTMSAVTHLALESYFKTKSK
jgi:hypothetical protein